MFQRDEFLRDHHLSNEDFESTQLNWDDLMRIASHHQEASEEKRAVGEFVLQVLRTVGAVHSLKMRIKSPARLIAKIIRKTLEDRERTITLQNYTETITDLVGIRALHLFKDDWQPIHSFVKQNWDLQETPIAYYREGDPKSVLDDFENAGCDLKKHPRGYRSVHYLLKCQPAKSLQIVELQVRTIFEEGWSEIDHRIRYSASFTDESLENVLNIFNRQAGSADEMGTFVKRLSNYIQEQDRLLESQKQQFKDVVAKLQISEQEKQELQRLNEQLMKLPTPPPPPRISDPSISVSWAALPSARLSGSGVVTLARLLNDPSFGFCEKCKQAFLREAKSRDSNLCPRCQTASP